MTALKPALPRDLQGRLDVICAKPVLRRVPVLKGAIEALVKDAYARRPAASPGTESAPGSRPCGCSLCEMARATLAAGEREDGVL